MADDARHPVPDLEPGLSARFDFFELLRRLERGSGRLFGHAGSPEREPARLGQHVRLAFATEDVARFVPADGEAPARVTISNFGLLGPEGPMPLHISRWVLDRLSQRWFADGSARETSDTTFIDFANLLQHRMAALFFRAWADATPGVQTERGARGQGGGRVRAMLESMAGTGLPGARTGDADAGLVYLRQAAALAHQVNGPERLTLFLAEAFGVPVRLEEFVGAWMEVPPALQTRVGTAYAALGQGAVIGPRVFGRQGRIELVLGPLGFADYCAFLPGGKRLPALRDAIRELCGRTLDVDVRLVLKEREIPAAKLGEAVLGRTSWLPRKQGRSGDARDMLQRTLVGWRPEAKKAAA